MGVLVPLPKSVKISTHFLGSKVLDMFLRIWRKGVFPPERCTETIILLCFKTIMTYFVFHSISQVDLDLDLDSLNPKP